MDISPIYLERFKSSIGEVIVMPKQIVIEVPDWMDENYVAQILRKLVEIESLRREFIEKTIKKLELTELDLENFEKFREKTWKEEARKYFSL